MIIDAGDTTGAGLVEEVGEGGGVLATLSFAPAGGKSAGARVTFPTFNPAFCKATFALPKNPPTKRGMTNACAGFS